MHSGSKILWRISNLEMETSFPPAPSKKSGGRGVVAEAVIYVHVADDLPCCISLLAKPSVTKWKNNKHGETRCRVELQANACEWGVSGGNTGTKSEPMVRRARVRYARYPEGSEECRRDDNPRLAALLG